MKRGDLVVWGDVPSLHNENGPIISRRHGFPVFQGAHANLTVDGAADPYDSFIQPGDVWHRYGFGERERYKEHIAIARPEP